VSGNELFQYELGKNFPVETAIVVGELYRYNNDWKFNAIGSGYSGGLSSLCNSFGIEVDEPKAQLSSVGLDKFELRKKGEVIQLQKYSGTLGEILVNLNWNRKKSAGGMFRAASGIDLDLGCLYELKDGTKGGVQIGSVF
jgi:tellurite resistance protein TerA